MSSPRIRISIAVLLFILLPAVTGVVAVHASATCERFVRTYVTTPVRNRVSKTTTDAWTKWRIAHPNWKPNPKLRRPKYLMTRDESMHKMDFACSVPTETTNLDLFFTPVDFDVPPPVVDLHAMDSTEIYFPNLIPPELAVLTPGPVFAPPTIRLQPPPAPGPTPEPASLLLVVSGVGAMGLMLRGRFRRVEPQKV